MHLSGFVYLSVFVFSLYQLPWAIILKSIPLEVSETYIFCPVIACICHRWHLQLSQGCYLILSFVTPGYHSDTIMASYPPTSHLTITWHSRYNVQPSLKEALLQLTCLIQTFRCVDAHACTWRSGHWTAYKLLQSILGRLQGCASLATRQGAFLTQRQGRSLCLSCTSFQS